LLHVPQVELLQPLVIAASLLGSLPLASARARPLCAQPTRQQFIYLLIYK
jgi:hypothetical protein